MSRVTALLGRLPAHLEATRPGKLLGEAAAALARDLDTLVAQLAAVRRAHRLGEADELADLYAIAALHGIRPGDFDVLAMRLGRAQQRLDAVKAAGGRAAALAAAEALLALWGLDVATPRLAAFAAASAPDLDGADGAAALDRLATGVGRTLRHAERLGAARTRIARICQRHANGNGTVAALLEGAAITLDLDLGPVEHSPDRFVHAAFVRDRLRLAPPPLPPPAPTARPIVPPPLPPAAEILGLIENPLRRTGTNPAERRSGERFDLVRRGFERALLQVRVTGTGDAVPHTLGPMLVNCDEGHGVGFAGTVPPGSLLAFDEDGRVLLDGADVTSLAFAFDGAIFADADAPSHAHDFGFDGAPTRFAVATPAGALDRDFAFPHAGENIPVPGIAIGVTRFAFFVADAYFAAGAAPTAVPVAPKPFQGVFDHSVAAPAGGETPTAAALVALSWVEHEAYKLRLMIPPRFREFEDDPEATELRRRIVQALARFRPAGIALEVDFVDDRWVLGDSTLGAAGTSAVAALSGGMALWPAPPDDGG